MNTISGPPTVLQLCTRLNIGGPARHVLTLATELSSRYEMLVAAGAADAGEGTLSHPSVAVQRVPLARRVQPLADGRAVRSVRRLLRDRDVQLVNTHMAKAGAVGRLAATTLRPRPRTVHTYHGHIYDGHFPDRVARAFLQVERALARVTDLLVAVSDEVRDSLLELGVGNPSQWRVSPVTLDLEPYLRLKGPSGRLRQALGLPSGVPLVGVLGRLAPVKNHVLLLEAMAQIPGAHLAMLGDGELRQALEAQAVALGMQSRVHFVGWWPDVPAALSDLDVVALSSHLEGTPVSLIEASAAARPVVATRVGGVPSVVDDGASGLLVPPGKVAPLRASLASLLENPNVRSRMGAAGRVYVRERFDASVALASTAACYDELLGL